MELIVGLAIMIMIATAVTPVVFSSIDRARVNSAVAALGGISEALDSFETDVDEHPLTLAQLVTPITTAQTDVCGSPYEAGTGKGGVDSWVGPYLDRAVPTTGIPIGIGVAQNTLTRVGATNKAGDIVITIPNVSIDDAESLDLELDGKDGRTGGSVRWPDPGSAVTVTVSYYKPTRRC